MTRVVVLGLDDMGPQNNAAVWSTVSWSSVSFDKAGTE